MHRRGIGREGSGVAAALFPGLRLAGHRRVRCSTTRASGYRDADVLVEARVCGPEIDVGVEDRQRVGARQQGGAEVGRIHRLPGHAVTVGESELVGADDLIHVGAVRRHGVRTGRRQTGRVCIGGGNLEGVRRAVQQAAHHLVGRRRVENDRAAGGRTVRKRRDGVAANGGPAVRRRLPADGGLAIIGLRQHVRRCAGRRVDRQRHVIREELTALAVRVIDPLDRDR